MTESTSIHSRSVLLVHRFAGYTGPRTDRARRLEASLRIAGEVEGRPVEVVRWPGDARPAEQREPVRSGRTVRSVLGDQAARFLIDRHEPKMWLRRRTVPASGIDAALLVSLPASPVVIAARWLREAGIPYVVDQGDPWGIGTEDFRGSGLASRRRRALERQMWEGAAGGVFTTDSQVEAVLDHVPDLPYLVRVNGYQPLDRGAYTGQGASRKQPDHELRLAHFGTLKAPRVPIGPTLEALARSGWWERVVFTQFGAATGHLPEVEVPEDLLTVEARDPIPWDRVAEIAPTFDAAVVIGNRPAHRAQLPSKTVEYLTLPIPRIALSSGVDGDELVRFASDLPGYLAVGTDDPDLPRRVAEFVRAKAAPETLLAPEEHSWDRVAMDVVEFFVEAVGLHEPASGLAAPCGLVG